MPTIEPLPRPQPNMVAAVAGLTGVGWRHSNQLNAFLNRLVGQELTELIERPTIRPSPFGLASRLLVRALSDARQILNGNGSVKLLGLSDDGGTDGMVQPLLKAPLPARQPLQDLAASPPTRPCALRGFLLKRCSYPGKSVSNLIQLFAVPTLTRAGLGNFAPTQINPEYLVGFDWLWRIVRQLNVDVVGAVPMLAQLGRGGLTPFEFAPLVIANLELDVLPTLQKRQANRPVLFPEGKNASVIISRRWPKGFDGLVLQLGSLAVSSDSGTNPNCLVGAQSKPRPNVVVNLALKGGFAGDRGLDGLIDKVASVGERLEQSLNIEGLLRRRLKLATEC